MLKVKIKATNSDAKQLLMGEEPAKKVGGVEQLKENPKSRQAENTNKSENSDITKVVAKTLSLPEPEANVVQGYDTPRTINRERKADSPEAARQRWNRARDMRTNLGVGKTSIVEVE